MAVTSLSIQGRPLPFNLVYGNKPNTARPQLDNTRFNMQNAHHKKLELKTKIKEQEVLQYELSSLKPKAKVYKQQQNSNVLFLSGVAQEMEQAKRNLDNLVQEYQQVGVSTQETERGEDEDREDTS